MRLFYNIQAKVTLFQICERKRSKFGKRSKTISEQIWKTKQTYKQIRKTKQKYNSNKVTHHTINSHVQCRRIWNPPLQKYPSIAGSSFIGSETKTAVQSIIAVFYKKARPGVMRYIKDGTLKAAMFSIVLLVILMYLSVLLCFINLYCLRIQIYKRVTLA